MFGNSMMMGAGGADRLLDKYTGAYAAYSLRRLSKNYNGALIRVQDSGVNNSLDIFPDASGNLDVAALTAFQTAFGTPHLVTWYDQSGNARNADGTLGRPILDVNAFLENGKPILRFDGNRVLVIPTFNLTSSYDVFATSRNLNTTANQGTGIIIARNIGTTGQVEGLVATRNGSTFRIAGGTTNNSRMATDDSKTWNLYNWNGASTQRNGSNLTEVTSSVPTTAGINAIGQYRNLYNSNCNTSEIIIYLSDKSADRADITNDIKNYWGTA